MAGKTHLQSAQPIMLAHHLLAHGWALAGGTPTMQRTRIVSEMLGRSFDQRK